MPIERLILLGWELGLWSLVGLGVLLGSLGMVVAFCGRAVYHDVKLALCLGAILGGLAGGILAFTAHELVFAPYAEHVAGLPECDEGCPVGSRPSYLPELERWTGKVR